MKLETRSFELRASADEDFTLEGTAVSYDCLSQDLGGYRERVMPGAFTRSLKQGADVKCLLNHDVNVVLGRTKSGTLRLQDTRKGLLYRCQLDEDSSTHRDIYISVKRGDLNECSFAFIIAPGGAAFDEVTENGKLFVRRTITDVAELRDVSVVTYPAYNAEGATSVAARTADAAIDDANRARCAAIGREIEADFQRRIAAAGEAIRADKLKEIGIKI
jgi:HK97 family phage prohead protease